jgi:hypothetical protein
VETNKKGNVSFTFTTDQSVPDGDFIAATATTGNGNTSDFRTPA